MGLALPRLCLALLLIPLSALATDRQALENARARALFERVFEEQVSLSPMYQTHLGRKTHYGEWDDISPAAEELEQRLYADQLRRVEALDAELLSEENRLNQALLVRELRQNQAHYRWRDHSYPVNQMFGLHAGIASFLINSHRVDNPADAEAYIQRLRGVSDLITQLIDNLERRAQKGVLAPAFVYPYVISDSRNLIQGAPFNREGISPLMADFTHKVSALELTPAEQKKLEHRAAEALRTELEPAYQTLISKLEQLALRADNRAGVWKLPNGNAYYQARLQAMTTTEMSAEEVHQFGLSEVARIHDEMSNLIANIGFEGSLAAFFGHIKDDPALYYPDTTAGRKRYLQDTREIIDGMRQALPQLFGHLPEADLHVKAVEPFREKSAGKAFYQAPAEDGSRPGIYYVNLHDLSAMPRYQMEALAYHEALPGHHMQIAIAQEMDELPAFRRHGHYTAYIEGWGLYAERVPKELGFYRNAYSDFGRLSFELWRAIRLVVDTGIHHYRWSRDEAITYFIDNSPMNQADATREVERYIVMPGQATSYKIGMEKILRLREKARAELGGRFKLREFHDQVLSSGALPLDILEQSIDDWIASK